MTGQDATEWWSTREAAAYTLFNRETLRKWARSDPPRVRSKEDTVGKQRRLLLHRGDVLREAAKSTPRGPQGAVVRNPIRELEGATSEEGPLRDRVAVLEEVVRRRRLIDEHRQAIERQHADIIRELQEIEELLLGPSWVPNG